MIRKKLSKVCPHVNGEKKVLQSNSMNCPCNNPGQIAQSVEHGTENPGVAGSIPALPTNYIAQL